MSNSLRALIYLEVLSVIGIVLFRMALQPHLQRLIDARTIALALLAPMPFFVAPNIWIPMAIVPVALVLASRSRAQLAGNYLVLLILVPALASTIVIGGTNIITPSVDAAIGLGGLIGLILLPARGKFHSPMLDLIVAALCILTVIADARGDPATQYIRMAIPAFFVIVVPYLLMSRGIADGADARTVILHLYFAGFVAAFIALFEVGRNYSLYYPVATRLGINLKEGTNAYMDVRAGLNRAQGAIRNSSGFGALMAILVVGLLGVRHWFRPMMFYGVAGALVLGLLLAQSRGAWLGAGAGYLAFCLYRRSYAQAAAIATVGLVAWVGVAALPRTGVLADTLGLSSGQAAGSADYRRLLFDEGVRQAFMHPWFGQSAASLDSSLEHLRQGQGIIDMVNTPLLIMLRLGVFGLLLWLMFWIMPLVLSWKGRPRGRISPDQALMFLPPAILVASFTALLFTSPYNRTMFWPLIAVGLAVPLIQLARDRGGQARQSRAAVPPQGEPQAQPA